MTSRPWGAGALVVALVLAVGTSTMTLSPARTVDWPEVENAARELAASRTSDAATVLDALEERARRRLAAIERPGDEESWKRAVPRLRERLVESLGLERLPRPRPRNLRQVGLLEREDHVLEKIVYGTFPGTVVPAHVYRPREATGPRPAVLFVPGHWWADSKARPSFQAFAINMARLGFVVLSHDPVGQGERGVSFRDHRRTSALIAGVSQQGLVLFESLCALEALLSRDDIDPERIGVTGASGGGYQSWMLAAIEPRVKVSVPVVGTSGFLEQIRVCRPLEWYRAKEHCHFVPGLLRYANNHELLALAAPRPVLVIAAARDESFPLAGIREVVAYGEMLYGTLGEEEGFGYFEDHASGHGYQREKREAAYGWFLRWLAGRGDGTPVSEPPTETADWRDPELRSFPPGENRPAGPGITARVRAIVDGLPRTPPLEPVTLRATIEESLGVELSEEGDESELRRGDWRAAAGRLLAAVSCEVPDGVELPGVLVAPRGTWRGAMIAISDEGGLALLQHAAVRAASRMGLAVLLADVRGTGELEFEERGWAFAVSLLLGESFTGRQALDAVRFRRALARLPELSGRPIGILGAGLSGSLAATYAAALDPSFAWLVADGGFLSYRAFIDRPRSLEASYRLAEGRADAWEGIDRELPAELAVFDVLRRFDIPDVIRAVLPRPVLVLRPVDGDREALSRREALERLEARRLLDAGVPEDAAGAARPSVACEEDAAEETVEFVEARVEERGERGKR